jgi:hypothetical protein
VSFLLDNLGLKALSLGLAVVLWFVIAGQKTSERGLQIPVELQNIPTDLELTGDPVNFVDVRLRASPGIIHAMGPAEISARLDLEGSVEGERIVHLTPDTIRVPFGVQVVKITPSILTLNFEKTLEKTVPVRPRVLGHPAPGHEVAEITSQPPEVHIAGPRTRVEEFESAFTEPVSVDAAARDVTETVSVGLDDPTLRLLDPPRVKVTARITEVRSRRTFAALPVAVRGGALLARPGQVKVVVAGPASALERLTPADVHAFVVAPDPDGAAPRTRVAVEFAAGFDGLTVADVDPEEVSLRPTRKED